MPRRVLVPSFLIFFLIVLSAPFSLAQKVKVDYDKNEDFSKLKTYAWVRGTPVANPNWNGLIRDYIDSYLKQKGLQRVDDANTADALVTYHAASEGFDLELSQSSDPTYAMYGGQPLQGQTMWSTGTIDSGSAYSVHKGSLAVHLFDRSKHELIWSATATGAVQDQTKQKLKALDKIMAEMFAKYPVK